MITTMAQATAAVAVAMREVTEDGFYDEEEACSYWAYREFEACMAVTGLISVPAVREEWVQRNHLPERSDEWYQPCPPPCWSDAADWDQPGCPNVDPRLLAEEHWMMTRCGVSITYGPKDDPYGSSCVRDRGHPVGLKHKGGDALGGGWVLWSGGGYCAGDPLPFTGMEFVPEVDVHRFV